MSHVDTLTGLVAVQAGIKSALQGIILQGRAVKVYDYDPGVTTDPIFMAMGAPELAFPEMESSQRQMGTTDVEFLWDVMIYVGAGDLSYAHTTALILMGGLTDAIEDDQLLGGVAEDCRVISLQPSFLLPPDGGTPILLVEAKLHGYYFVDQ